ncbi:MAG: multicopper oxidase domain-containing protein, partial [Nitrosopumilus sp.]|nr:multicopper oxidase domain-containing protein [Nitrosopumilus sp.]
MKQSSFNSRSIMIFSLITVVAISSVFFVFPESIKAQSEEKVFVTHSGGVVRTTGEIIDPLYVEATMEFDPMEYLRDFDYGITSPLPDGTTLREYTVVAEDDKIMEVSPGVFYNAWTFNGSVPGPTIRATEGDTVRINFINNGSKQHTMHFQGI